MSKYNKLWKHIQKEGTDQFTLTFAEVEEFGGVKIDHSFLNAKNELLAYGFQVDKISLRNETVAFSKVQ